MRHRAYQAIQNRRDAEHYRWRVQGYGGNSVYGGTRESFHMAGHSEPYDVNLPLAGTEWEGIHKTRLQLASVWMRLAHTLVGLGAVALAITAAMRPDLPVLALGALLGMVLLIGSALRTRTHL